MRSDVSHLIVEGMDRDPHFVPPHYVFATRQSLAAQHGDLQIEEEQPDATT
jgi:hypothetical protein